MPELLQKPENLKPLQLSRAEKVQQSRLDFDETVLQMIAREQVVGPKSTTVSRQFIDMFSKLIRLDVNVQ